MISAKLASATHRLVTWSDYDSTHDKAQATYSNSAVRNNAITYLDESRFIIAYRGSGFYLHARIGELDHAGNITFGSETVIHSVIPGKSDIVALDDSTVAVVYWDITNARGLIVAVSVSGTSISNVGTPVEFYSGNVFVPAMVAMNNSEVLFVYERASDNYGIVRYASISGTTVTLGNSVTLSTSNNRIYDIVKVSPNEAVIANNTATSGVDGHLISYSGTTPSVDDSIAVSSSGNVSLVYASQIRDNKALFIYDDTGNADSRASIIEVSAGTLSKGTEVVFNDTGAPKSMSAAVPDRSHAVASVLIDTVGLESTVIDIAGSGLSANTIYENETTDMEVVDSTAVGGSFVVLAYEDDDDASKGKVKVLCYKD